MELDRKVFLSAPSQVKAYKDVVVLRDSGEEGYIDILYMPKTGGFPKAVFKMAVRAGGSAAGLFDDAPVEKLGGSVVVYLQRVKDVLKNGNVCVIKKDAINNILAGVDATDLNYRWFQNIEDFYDGYLQKLKKGKEIFGVSFSKNEWEYAVKECSKFVSGDDSRYHMNGICFGFFTGGKGVVNIVGTDGKKMILIEHARRHEDGESPANKECQFIVPPSYLFAPSSDYASVTLRLGGGVGSFSIVTEDNTFEGAFACINGKFPDYPKAIPAVDDETQWFSLCPSSLRSAAGSVKSPAGKRLEFYLDARNPDRLSVTAGGGGGAAFEAEGSASRPMRLSFLWEQISPCFFEGGPPTKFYLNGGRGAILSRSNKAVKGSRLDVIKVFIPTYDEKNYGGDVDAFNMPAG